MALSHEQFLKHIKDRQGDMSLRAYALTLGVTVGYLSDVYLGKRDVGPTLANAFGYTHKRKTTVSFVRNAA